MTLSAEQWYAECPMCRVEALEVQCPICDASPGQPCEDAIGGWVQRTERPHLYRIAVAQEVTMSVAEVKLPAGVSADAWSSDAEPCRVIWGSTQAVTVGRPSNEGLTTVSVYTHAVQRADGHLSYDPSDGGPGVSIDTHYRDEDWARDTGVTVSSDEARDLAAALLAAAEEVDGCADR
ncbi:MULTISPECIES: hypothetical protein [Mycobacteriaceae]|uniref:Uncharacterized protein n=1 Tax=Mycolicibacterium parafortuitum TaxID=39692 RepID=A0ACC6MK79_MYCPF|nr:MULTISPECIES: hypothetical protein [Mycobacteriaceae]MDZ5087379.1 hypothetical protein [Mycolicibacterium parafortuitum]GFM19362.1 uncharacterized protein PO1_contig-047-4 [Mycobacterium sp. PO1]GFM22916.1 uncharacterized protein PO2_contig-020-4 [Mycobacterium sp. PO2]